MGRFANDQFTNVLRRSTNVPGRFANVSLVVSLAFYKTISGSIGRTWSTSYRIIGKTTVNQSNMRWLVQRYVTMVAMVFFELTMKLHLSLFQLIELTLT